MYDYLRGLNGAINGRRGSIWGKMEKDVEQIIGANKLNVGNYLC
jgi:hypothetical protein